MRTALSRYCLAMLVSASLPALSHGSLAYSAKHAGTEVFRVDKLEPPPLASLGQGEKVRLIRRGPAASLIETEGGIKGWVSNEDLLAMAGAESGNFRMKDVLVNADLEFNHSFNLIDRLGDYPDVLPLDRNFDREIPEAMDKEQTEMRHDEN